MSTSTTFPTELRLPAPRPKAIDVAAALDQVGGDFEFVMAVMRDEFLAKAPVQIARCVTNARLADLHGADATDADSREKRDAALKVLAFEAHSMKGASATLHADALSKACHRLERVAKGVPLDALEPNASDDAPGMTFERRTREVADRFAELEADVADLAAITDVDVAAASEALGSRLCVTLARLAEDAAALAASPAAVAAAAARAGGAAPRNEPLASLARAVAADAKAVGARALRNAVRRMDALVFSLSYEKDAKEESDSAARFKNVVAAFVELRRAAQTAAFDCAAVCSFEETKGFARKTRGSALSDSSASSEATCAFSRVRLVDASTARGDLFDAAATAAEARRAFSKKADSRLDDVMPATSPGSNHMAADGEQRNTLDEFGPPLDFPNTVRALDGDVAFAEKMLRTFLADAETFAAKPLAVSQPNAPPNAQPAPESRSRPSSERRAPRRLSEEHRRDARLLTESADWLGAPPLRAAIAALLERDAGEDAVRAARRAVSDLRAFADGLESRVGGAETRDPRSGTSSPSLPKKSASTDQVMRSGLYAHSSSSLTTSGGGSADFSGRDESDESAATRRLSRESSDISLDGVSRERAGERTDEGSLFGAFGATRERPGSWGGSSGRVSADSAGAVEGAVTALAALSPRARARGLAAVRAPRRRRGALAFDLPRALERAGGDWDFAMGCAGRHAELVREQIAVLRAVMLEDPNPPGLPTDAESRHVPRDEARIVASAIAQLRSVAEGAKVSHAPKLMDAVEALAAALVSAAANELKADTLRAADASSSDPMDSSWRVRAAELLRVLEKRADEYAKAVDAAACTSRAFSPRFVFSDLCGGDAAAATEKLRVLASAAHEAHVAAVRAVAAAEASFGAAALGGTFRDEDGDARGDAEPRLRGGSGEDRSSGDEDDVSAAETFRGNDGVNDASSESSARGVRARGRGGAPARVPREILNDVRLDLSRAFGSLEACERLAASLGARPSERAFRGAAARVARVAVDVSAAAAGVAGAPGPGPPREAKSPSRENAFAETELLPRVPACFLDDEHTQTVAALAALKREVEALAADFHVIAPSASLSAAPGEPRPRGTHAVSGFVSRLSRRFGARNDPNGNPLASLAMDWRAFPASAARLAHGGGRRLRASLCSENAVVGAATALVTAYTAARLFGAALGARTDDGET